MLIRSSQRFRRAGILPMFVTLLLALAVATLADAGAADLLSFPLQPKDALAQLLTAAQEADTVAPLSFLAPTDTPVRVAADTSATS